jgi:hypothetical protein
MYAFLGDKATQDGIRKRNKKKTHCSWLKKCSTACDALPTDIGEEGKAGEPCPLNPIFKYKDIFDKEEQWAEIIEEANYYEGLISLNCFPTDVSEVSPTEFQIALVVRRFMDEREYLIRQASDIESVLGAGEGDSE